MTSSSDRKVGSLPADARRSGITKDTTIESHFRDELYRAQDQLIRRKRVARLFQGLCNLAVLCALAMLVVLLINVLAQGLPYLSWQFLDSFPSRFPAKAGIKSALWGSVWLMGLTALIVIPFGVGAAIYLEELMRPSKLKRVIDINIANLASVPSIVFGILGLAVFVRLLGFNRSVLAGAFTLAILVLPIIIIASREALKSVPPAVREGALALGVTKWQATRDLVIPAALPGILTGIILSISRAIGETAPLIMIGALTFIAFVPEGPLDMFTALPIQIFNWTSRPQEEFHGLAAAGIIVLLVLLLSTNALAIYLRNRARRKNICQLL